MSTKKKGTDGVLARNTNTYASPSWSALAVKDLKFTDMPSATFDTSDRTSDFDTSVPTRTKFAIEFEFYYAGDDTGHVALVVAATTGRDTGIELLCTDGTIGVSGVKGVRATWLLESGLENDMKLTDGQLIKMKATPHGNASNAPTRYAA